MEVKKRKRDQTRIEVSEGSSATLWQLSEKADARKAEKKVHDDAAEAKKAAAKAKKQAAAQEKINVAYWYARCKETGECACGQTPC